MSDYYPLQEKFRAAFPDKYERTKIYDAVVFGYAARVYVIKSKFHIIENDVENLPFGSQLQNYLSRRYRPIKRKALQYEIPAEDADNVIALLKTGRLAK